MPHTPRPLVNILGQSVDGGAALQEPIACAKKLTFNKQGTGGISTRPSRQLRHAPRQIHGDAHRDSFFYLFFFTKLRASASLPLGASTRIYNWFGVIGFKSHCQWPVVFEHVRRCVEWTCKPELHNQVGWDTKLNGA